MSYKTTKKIHKKFHCICLSEGNHFGSVTCIGFQLQGSLEREKEKLGGKGLIFSLELLGVLGCCFFFVGASVNEGAPGF